MEIDLISKGLRLAILEIARELDQQLTVEIDLIRKGIKTRPCRYRTASTNKGVKTDLILKGPPPPPLKNTLRPCPKERPCPFLHASITSVSGQVVPSLRAVSLPDTSGRARQLAEASRTAGRCACKAFGTTGSMAGKDAIDKRQGGE